MGYFAAFWGGFASFYSIWQVCILQISPFFMLFITGLFYTVQRTGEGSPNIIRWIIVPSIPYTVGFSLFYGLLSARGLYAGRYLAYHIESLQFISGLFFLFVSLFFIFSDRLQMVKKGLAPPVVALLFLLLGVAFAFIYSPCITPTLSTILGIAVRPESSLQGAVLAGLYGFGMSLAFLATGFALIYVLKRRISAVRYAGWLKDGCAVLFLILAAMNISGVMVYYKAFFLGMLVQ